MERGGESLDWYRDNCSVETVFMVMIDVTKGLEFLHHKDIIHRDLKPANIIIAAMDTGGKLVEDVESISFVPSH